MPCSSNHSTNYLLEHYLQAFNGFVISSIYSKDNLFHLLSLSLLQGNLTFQPFSNEMLEPIHENGKQLQHWFTNNFGWRFGKKWIHSFDLGIKRNEHLSESYVWKMICYCFGVNHLWFVLSKRMKTIPITSYISTARSKSHSRKTFFPFRQRMSAVVTKRKIIV